LRLAYLSYFYPVGKRFNLRVYGILISEGKVLVSDEYIKGNHITKFPGGGLEFGEGTIDCVLREFREELNVEVKVKQHFYTTDFFVNSAFDIHSQVISIYYIVEAPENFKPRVAERAFSYENQEGAQSFRWIPLEKLSDQDFTLIIDKKVGEMLARTYASI
jgi:8-oxo-dGTP diphosphatase